MARNRNDLLGLGAPQKFQMLVDLQTLKRVLGCSESAITKLAHEGVIERPARAKYDLAQAVPAFIAYKTKKSATDESADKARKLKAEADLAELKTAKLQSTVLDAKDVELAWAGILRDLKAQLLAIPAKLQANSYENPADVAREVDMALRGALKSLGENG